MKLNFRFRKKMIAWRVTSQLYLLGSLKVFLFFCPFFPFSLMILIQGGTSLNSRESIKTVLDFYSLLKISEQQIAAAHGLSGRHGCVGRLLGSPSQLRRRVECRWRGGALGPTFLLFIWKNWNSKNFGEDSSSNIKTLIIHSTF